MHRSFDIKQEQKIEYLKAVGRLYKHKTGAVVIHIANNDPVNVVSLSFHTPPQDNSGAAHIVEHCVLSGSSKYPLKDPSAELAKSSLYTYLNAITFNDRTIYITGSFLEKSLRHMSSVYFDGVFNPVNSKETFMREGWHYKYNPKSGAIDIGGIVYNEMLGSYSSPLSKLYTLIKSAIFPDSAMRFENAGRPCDIPSLAYEKFLEYYNNHYTASNCFAVLYGNAGFYNIFENLDFYLNSAKAKGSFIKPARLDIHNGSEISGSYYIAKNENIKERNFIAVAYVLDEFDEASLSLLNSILFGTSSPFYIEFMKTKTGEDISGHIINECGLPLVLYITVHNTKYDASYIVKVIEEILSSIYENGIGKNIISQVFSSIELLYKEKDFGYRTTGVVTAIESSFDFIKGFDIFKRLDKINILNEIKQKAYNNAYFENIIRCMLKNKKRSVAVLNAEHENKAVLHTLKETKKNIDSIKKEYRALEEFNAKYDSIADLAKIPAISLADMKKDIEELPEYTVYNKNILFVPLETDGISYINIRFDISHIPQKYWQQIALLKILLPYSKTETINNSTLLNKIHTVSNGFNWSFEQITTYGTKELRSYLILSSKFLYCNSDKVFECIQEIINNLVFYDKDNIKEIIFLQLSNMRSKIMRNYMDFALLSASEGCFPYNFQNTVSGIPFYRYLCYFCSNMNEMLDNISKTLTGIYELIFDRQFLSIQIGGQQYTAEKLVKLSHDFYSKVSFSNPCSSNIETKNERLLKTGKRQAIIIQPEIAFNAACSCLFDEHYERSGGIEVLINIILNEFILPQIRLKGNAYDALAGINQHGNIYICSYRDPNISATYDIINKIHNFIKNYNATYEYIQKFIIGTLKNYDMPKKNINKFNLSVKNHLSKTPENYEKKMRDEVFNTTLSQINLFSGFLKKSFSNISLCTLASNKMIEIDKGLFDSIEAL